MSNSPPASPTINGPTSGQTKKNLLFTFNAIDPDGDNVSFHIDWGDGNTETTVFVPSGTDKAVPHIWNSPDTYTITASAEDAFGSIGPSTTFTVVIPREKAINRPFLIFLENHPNLFLIIQQFIGL
jgi:hypothetical protein